MDHLLCRNAVTQGIWFLSDFHVTGPFCRGQVVVGVRGTSPGGSLSACAAYAALHADAPNPHVAAPYARTLEARCAVAFRWMRLLPRLVTSPRALDILT